MRVVLLSEMFSENMGYLENMLPKYFARLGIDSHLVAMDLPANYLLSTFEETYGEFAGGLKAGTVKSMDGYTLHVLPHKKIAGYMRMMELRRKLSEIGPDIVQAMTAVGWVPLDAARFSSSLGYKLFTGNHTHASVFPLAQKKFPAWSRKRLQCFLTRTIPGWFISRRIEKCYPIAADCADIAQRFLGVPRRKIAICPLGVDTDIFHPCATADEHRQRAQLRQTLGFCENEIVCIYTGRMTEDKNPLLLARAIAHLGSPFRGLFAGEGPQAAAIKSTPGCVVRPFVAVTEMGPLLRAADIGVWPTQESMSMLDAAASGLPVVINETMGARERLKDCSLLFKPNDLQDLAAKLMVLTDLETREKLGMSGARQMAKDFSWESVARRRVRDYEAALGSGAVSTKLTH